MGYTHEGAMLREYKYIHRQTGEEHQFDRLLTHYFIRKPDGKRFSPQVLNKLYEQQMTERRMPGDHEQPRECVKCGHWKVPSSFYEGKNGKTKECRVCLSKAARLRKAVKVCNRQGR